MTRALYKLYSKSLLFIIILYHSHFPGFFFGFLTFFTFFTFVTIIMIVIVIVIIIHLFIYSILCQLSNSQRAPLLSLIQQRMALADGPAQDTHQAS